jgi:hypothetical protein
LVVTPQEAIINTSIRFVVEMKLEDWNYKILIAKLLEEILLVSDKQMNQPLLFQVH